MEQLQTRIDKLKGEVKLWKKRTDEAAACVSDYEELEAELEKYRSDKFKEKLANLCHEQWSGWMGYLFGKCVKLPNGKMVMPKWAVERWSWQMITPYSKLSGAEKDSDRDEADRFIKLILPEAK